MVQQQVTMAAHAHLQILADRALKAETTEKHGIKVTLRVRDTSPQAIKQEDVMQQSPHVPVHLVKQTGMHRPRSGQRDWAVEVPGVDAADPAGVLGTTSSRQARLEERAKGTRCITGHQSKSNPDRSRCG
ncbi:hypothetical protein llap_4209 [Limosa lapponica baueri]|uniref:Uncharacterized protein n=1 Tax=Limosa lapponica baueri TaxID=1758121 RepID=A0A2I0UHJ3_LIMLA|nr:hypothetical protein llap_4209 [Limosa lapponica baueri]